MANMLGDYKTALHFSTLRFEASEALFNKTGERISFDTATHNDLGACYAMNRMPEKALEMLEKSAELRRQMKAFKKDWLFSPFYHMGIVYYTMGKYEAAAKVLQEAIVDRLSALGPNDRSSSRTGALFYVLGNVRWSQGLFDEAYTLHQRALIQCKQTAGSFALVTLRVSQRLAEDYERYGMVNEAQ